MTNIKAPIFKYMILGFYALLMSAPLWVLLFFNHQSEYGDSDLFHEARSNTFWLALCVTFLSSVIGYGLSFVHFFYRYPGKKYFASFLMLPLALPAYVLAFIYLGLSFEFMDTFFLQLQGKFWFLVLVLSIVLAPYVFFFTGIGFRSVSRSEWETELLLRGGFWKFFKSNILPKTLPFLMSAQILVLFECLSDFGAASMINVPVITTMIYKLWFDLFSFEGAVALALRYSLVIGLVLVLEGMLRSKNRSGDLSQRDPFNPQKPTPLINSLILGSILLFVSFSVLIPLLKTLSWGLSGLTISWGETFEALKDSLVLALGAGALVFIASWGLMFLVKGLKEKASLWHFFSTIGYSIPGSLLAVSVYALLLQWVSVPQYFHFIFALILALAYKFLTVAFRPLMDQSERLPSELSEISEIMNVGAWKKINFFYWPYLKEASLVGFLLVAIEVLKEMPLTLMLAPSGFQTLSIKIFNYTSEGEWEKAALPSLLLIFVGFVSTFMLSRRGEKL